MTIMAIDKNETFDFVSSFDKGESKTVFKLGVLPNRIKINVFSKYMSDKGFDIKNVDPADLIKILLAGIKGIDGIMISGKSLILGKDDITESIIETLPLEIFMELVGALFSHNFVGEQDKKN
jgi:hypothetical protein